MSDKLLDIFSALVHVVAVVNIFHVYTVMLHTYFSISSRSRSSSSNGSSSSSSSSRSSSIDGFS